MKIGFDVDDTLIWHTPQIVEWHNDMYGTSLMYEDFFTFQFNKVWGGTREEAMNKINQFFKTHYFFEAQPIEGATKVVNLLYEDEKHIVTGRKDEFREITEYQAVQHFGDIFCSYNYANTFSEIRKPVKKSEIALKLGLDLVVEDGYEYARDISSVGIPVILFNRPWNLDREELDLVVRVNTWYGCFNEIKKIRN